MKDIMLNRKHIWPIPTFGMLFITAGIGLGGIDKASEMPGTRPYEMGLSYWPQHGRETKESLIHAGVGQSIALSEHLLVQIPWSPTHPNIAEGAAWMAGIAREHNRGLTIALDWLEPSRDRLRDSEHSWGFYNQKDRTLFIRSVSDCAARHMPNNMILGIEVNYYAYSDPDDFKEFVQVYADAYREIKRVSPGTNVLVTFQYEVLMGLDPKWKATAGLGPIISFGPLLDMNGLSCYPFLAGQESEKLVSEKYFEPIRALGRPWGIFETSRPTLAASKSDWKTQADFARLMLSACARSDASIVIWCGTTDTYVNPHSGPKSALGQDGTWMANLGLCDVYGKPKTAVAAWRSAMSLARRPIAER